MSQQIGAIVDESLVAELDEIALAENRTRSNVIENLIREALKVRKNEQK